MPSRCLLAAVLLPLLAACADTPSSSSTAGAADDAAFDLLTRLDASAVTEAYQRLDHYAYTAEVRLTAQDDEGSSAATRTVRRLPTDDGVEERLVSAEGDAALGRGWSGAVQLSDPLPALLPDEPAFLSPRSREDYRYRLADTLLGSTPARLVEAAVRPDVGDKQAIRRVRFFLHPRTDEVLGIEVVRRSTSVLYDEDAKAGVLLRPGPEGDPVPALAVAETTVNVPGAPSRRVRLVQRFTDVRALP